jgi:hypothetical protein
LAETQKGNSNRIGRIFRIKTNKSYPENPVYPVSIFIWIKSALSALIKPIDKSGRDGSRARLFHKKL